MHEYKEEDTFWREDQSDRLAAQLDFLIEADKIKKIFRQTRLVHDQRYENDAEHAWHFGLYAMVPKDAIIRSKTIHGHLPAMPYRELVRLKRLAKGKE